MASVEVLFTGYGGEGVASTVSLIRDGSLIAVVDPGMVPDHRAILDPLAALELRPEEVTDVVISHHHPDHTMNIALFPRARVHDHWATYERDQWTSRPAEGFRLSDHVWLVETPGHTPQDITTLAETDNGVFAFTHLWWGRQAVTDRLAWDLDQLMAGRDRIRELATVIVPGHGEPFPVSEAP
ncbi:MAG: MBL fold metallo-hydrolase [Acidimicrobiia bacterium]